MSTNLNSKNRVLSLAIISLMSAITVLLFTTPIGTIVTPVVTVTIAHLPIMITTIVFGIYPGLAVALVFSITSIIKAIMAPGTVLDPLFINPLVSVLPRMIIPVTTYYAYKLLSKISFSKKLKFIDVSISVFIGNLTNTIGVLSMLYILYADTISKKTGENVLNMFIKIGTAAASAESLLIVIIATPITLALLSATKNSSFRTKLSTR